MEFVYAVPRNSLTRHLILLLIINKKHKSDWPTTFSVSGGAGLKKGTALTKSHTVSFHLDPFFTPIVTRKHIKSDAFAPRLSLHMQCARDKCRFNGIFLFRVSLVLKKLITAGLKMPVESTM